MKIRIFNPIGNETICTHSFNTPSAAIEWAKAYIQSWPEYDWEEA